MHDDRWFWLTVRRALLMIAKAIEVRYLGGSAESETMPG